MELKEAVKNLPKQPGIYLMKDKADNIIYVGKAKNLKARVSQYFQKNKNNSSKVNEMVAQIHSFEYICLDTELEAFLLECETIKKLKPRYNSLLKNYKNYRYIKLTAKEEYPGLSMTTGSRKDGNLYYGPFTNRGAVENAIQFVKDSYLIRKCGGPAVKKGSSGCLNFHLGTCLGPCTGKEVREEYGSEIKRIVRLLDGKDRETIKELQVQMRSAADSLDFEKAASLRDQLLGIRHILNKQKIIKISSYGRNILAIEKYGENAVKLFLIKGNRLLNMELLKITQYDENSLKEKLENLITDSFKLTKNSGVHILSQEDIDEAQIIYSYLKNKNNGIRSVKIPMSRIDSPDCVKIAAEIRNAGM